MDPLNAANLMSGKYLEMLSTGITDGKSLLAFIAKVLDAEFQKAIPTYMNVDITTPKGTLSFEDVTGLTIENVWRIARDVEKYWAKTIELTGEPQKCDEIKEVKNDSKKIIEPIATQLLSLYQGSIETPSYFKFCSIIITNVKTIIWNVKESDSDCSSDFVVQVN